MKLTPMTCTNCAGTINRATMTCEYCGTQFESLNANNEMVMVVEHQSSQVRVLRTQTSIPAELLRDDCMAKNSVAYMAMDDIRRQLAKALEDCMTIEMTYDIKTMRQIITAKVRVLEPDFRF